LLACYYDWGIFAGVPWYYALLYSFSAALVANGVFDISIVKAFLQLIKFEAKKV
jgi:hypothetical protein